MYKQLRDWMIYGNLNDKYEEFYICYDNNNSSNETTMTDKQAHKTQEDDPGLINEIEDIFLTTRFSSSFCLFSLNSSKLPSYINLKIANKILFTGELLQLFQAKYLNEIYTSGDAAAQNTTVSKVQYISESDKCKVFDLCL